MWFPRFRFLNLAGGSLPSHASFPHRHALVICTQWKFRMHPLQSARAVCLSTCPLELSPVYFVCLGLSRFQFLTPVVHRSHPPCLLISELQSGSPDSAAIWGPASSASFLQVSLHHDACSPVLKNCCFSCFIYFKNCFKREGLSNPCYSILAGSESPQLLQFFSLFFHIHPQAPSYVHTIS